MSITLGRSTVLIIAPLHFAISTRHDIRQLHTAPKTGELARLTTPGIDASRIERGLIDFSPRRTQRGVAVTKGRNIYRAKPVLSEIEGTQRAPRKTVNSKHEIRSSKQCQMTKNPMFQTNSLRTWVLDFNILNFEIVSDFDIRISNLGNKLGASKFPRPGVQARLKICAGYEKFQG